MKAIQCSVLMVHLAAGLAYGQTFSDLQIQLGAYNVSDHGGEKPVGVWRSTGPVIIGRPTMSTFSLGDSCEGFTVSAARGDVGERATTAWQVEVTPIRVVRDAVTFRLRWVRFAALRQQFDQVPLDSSKSPHLPSEDIELTLRPGESWPVDRMRVLSGTRMVDGRTCRGSASIRVLVDTYPSEDFDRRLVGADLWLIERLSNGTEVQRGQVPAVRGVPNHPFPFYFDSLVDGNASLDIYGMLTARIESGALVVSVETRSRWDASGLWRSVESVIQMKPGETVEIRLPKLVESAGPFTNREFALRIRARQLR